MKVLLIRPPHQNMITTNVPGVVDTETGMYPPLGLLYVAAGLKAWTDAEVKILDLPALHLEQEGAAQHIGEFKPDVVGIQAMTFTFVDTIATVRTVKNACPNTHVCLGGPHVNLYPRQTLSIEGVDSIVLGEGERPFAELVNALCHGTDIAEVPGVPVIRDGAITTIQARALEWDLDSLPQPPRNLIDQSLYWSVLAKRNPVTTAMTSRGCPCKCIFCDRPHLGKAFRYRSAVSVVDEMDDCVKRGIHEIFLYDDTFTINRKRIFDIRDKIKRRNLDVNWDIRARADTLDSAVVAAMKEAGVVRVHIGVESASPRVLEIMKKGVTVEQARNAIELCRKFGIISLVYFMLGNPGETSEDVNMTMEFLRTCRADYAHISITTPFPGTELYRMGLEKGLFERDYWLDFASNPDPSFQPPVWNENFTQEQLKEMRQRAYRLFYGRPGRLFKQLLAVRSFKELCTKAGVGAKLLFKNAGKQ